MFPTEKHLQEFHRDKFDYQSLSKKILDEVLIKMELPNCFGLYGNWGSGKTTLLSYVRKHLEGSQKKYQSIRSVYFDPVKYEHSDQKDLLFALLNCIKKELKVNSKVWKKLMIDSLVIASGLLRTATGGLIDARDTKQDFEDIEEKLFQEHESWIDKIEEFKTHFEDVIKKGLGEDAQKLFIFIDDLDRCLPENAVKLLEGIKNFLSVENTLFVLAIDRRIMSEMIEKKYGLHHGYGDEYLMKIIHYYYKLPILDLKEITREILHSYGLRFVDRQSSYISEFLKNEAKEPRIAKHILHQFCMTVILAKNTKKELDSDESGVELQYMFVASFLLTKFPELFSMGNTLERFKNIRSFSMSAHDSDTEKYKNVVSRDESIKPSDRKKLEGIMKYPIVRANEASPSNYIDIEKLNGALIRLKRI